MKLLGCRLGIGTSTFKKNGVVQFIDLWMKNFNSVLCKEIIKLRWLCVTNIEYSSCLAGSSSKANYSELTIVTFFILKPNSKFCCKHSKYHIPPYKHNIYPPNTPHLYTPPHTPILELKQHSHTSHKTDESLSESPRIHLDSARIPHHVNSCINL